MKNAFIPFFLSLTFSLSFADTAMALEKRKALLIGIGKYANAPWSESPLHASYGLDLMVNTLKGYGFSANDLQVLRDGNATFRDMEREVNGFVENLEKGTQVMLYLYGHGVHIADDDSDEEDGLDEAFVPYDGRWISRERHRNLIRDDLLGSWVEAMRRKTGPEGFVLVLLDACHSGSSLRGNVDDGIALSRTGLNATTNDAEVAPMAVLYSSLPHQPSTEILIDQRGKCALMSWAFVQAMGESGSGSTWRAVFERTALNMSARTRKQTPAWEGETDRLMFGQRLKPPPRYFRIIGQIDSQNVLIDGGRLHGLDVGGNMLFFPADTRDTQGVAPWVTGRINGYCGVIESRVELFRPIPDPVQTALWVFPVTGSSAAYPIPIHFAGSTREFQKTMVPSTEDIPGIQWVDSLQARLFIDLGDNRLRLSDRDRGTLMEWSDKQYWEEEQMRLLRGRILRWQIARFLASWENSDETMQVSLLVNKGDAAVVEMDDFKDRALALEADILQVRVRNSGAKPIYYSLVDIDPDDEVSVLIPSSGRMPEEFRVLPGAESRTHRIRFDKRGLQVLKLMASTVPVKLEASIGTRGLPQDRPLDAAFPEGTRLRLQDLPLGNSGSFHTATLELFIE